MEEACDDIIDLIKNISINKNQRKQFEQIVDFIKSEANKLKVRKAFINFRSLLFYFIE